MVVVITVGEISFYVGFAYAFAKEFTAVVLRNCYCGTVGQYSMARAARDMTHVDITFIPGQIT